MNKRRKNIQAKLRRKYKYSTYPTTCRNGTYLETPEKTYERYKSGTWTKYVQFEIGRIRREEVHINVMDKPADDYYSYDKRHDFVLTFEEIECLYNITQELKKEWRSEE